MKPQIRQVVAAAALAMCVALNGTAAAAQHDKHASESVAGNWTMTVEGNPHGATTMGLSLKQEGKAVSGTFASPHGDMQVKGEFVDGNLTLSTTGNGEGSEITFKAKLNQDGSLSGYLSSSMGDMTWKATRAKEKE